VVHHSEIPCIADFTGISVVYYRFADIADIRTHINSFGGAGVRRATRPGHAAGSGQFPRPYHPRTLGSRHTHRSVP
jgi:hypothetical protein